MKARKGTMRFTSGGPVFEIDGAIVTREEWNAAFPSKESGGCEALAGSQKACWPMVSEALAVHPKQVAQANARAKAHGIAVTYRPDGMVVISDRNARKKLLRLENLHDNKGGYGD